MKNYSGLGATALSLTACASVEPEGPSAVATVRPTSGSQVHGNAGGRVGCGAIN